MDSLCFSEELLTKAAAIKAGATEVAGISRQRYIDRLTWLKELCRFNVSNIGGMKDRNTFYRVSQTLENLLLDDSNGKIRKQPYCIMLTGYPGAGKTSFAMHIASAYMKAKYGKFSSSEIVTLNETDDFQSEFRTNHRVVIFDDISATKPEKTLISPWRKVIDFVNNVRKTALNPNVELKGNVYIEPDLVIMTTNKSPEQNYGIHHYMECPQAIMRRISHHVFLFDYESCQEIIPIILSGRSKGMGAMPDLGRNGTLTAPITLKLKLSKQRIDLKPGESTQDFALKETREEFIQRTISQFLQHMEEQEAFIQSVNNIFDVSEHKTLAQSFFDDMIKPHLPTTIPLSSNQEAMLPWYTRWGRKCCVKDKNIASFQMEPQAGELHALNQVRLTHPENYRSDMIHEYLLRNLNIEHYLWFRPSLDDAQRIWLLETGFRTRDGNYTLFPLEHENCYENCISFTREQLDKAASILLNYDSEYEVESPRLTNLHLLSDQEEEQNAISNEISSISNDESDSVETPVISTLEQISEQYFIPIDKSMKFDTRVRPLDQYMSILLECIPPRLSMVAYEWRSSFGYGDFIFSHKQNNIIHYIVLELKSNNPTKVNRQAQRYLDALSIEKCVQQAKGHVLGVAFTPFSSRIFTNNPGTIDEDVMTCLEDWFKIFKDRCGAIDHSSE